MRLCAGLVLAGAVLAVGPLPAPPASGVPAPPRVDRDTTVLHRVVWDQHERRGTHLWSANPDGTDARKIYERHTGFVTGITLNRQGTEAAVAPTVLSADHAALVVVDVLGAATPVNLLEDHPEIYSVGAIGWSPSGRKLAFEGAVRSGPRDLATYLFTVRRDGGGLRRVSALGHIADPSEIGLHYSLAWTASGIFRYDGVGLHVLRHGRDSLVLRGAIRLAISGDGEWLFVERRRGQRYALWRMHPDGSALERLYALNAPGYGYVSAPDEGYTYYWQPSYDGSLMLSQLDGVAPTFEARVIAHDATRAPAAADVVLPFTTIGAITWN